MITKLYDRIKKYIKNNIWFLVIIISILVIDFVRLPFMVEMPGGTIRLNDRIKVDGNKVDVKGSFNMSYVSVSQGNIPYILLGLINKDWDIVKEEKYDNESLKDMNMRDKLYLEESKSNALIAALSLANEDYTITKNHNYVAYVDKKAKTNLKIKDEIVSCDDILVDDVLKIREIIDSKKENDIISFDVLDGNKNVKKEAKVFIEAGKRYVGISVITVRDVKSDKKITISSKNTESGPSGGLMMSLIIYSALTGEDLTNGKKIVGTGTISSEGRVGEIGGVKYKIMGAEKGKADIFLVPKENYEEAIKTKKEKGYKLEIVKIETLEEAVNYLRSRS